MNEINSQIEIPLSEGTDIRYESDPQNNANNLFIEVNKEENLSPYYHSTIFGKLFFNWSRYAMKIANKNPLKIPDFRGIEDKDKSENLFKALDEKWNEKKAEFLNEEMKENSFYYSILKTYYKWIIVLSILNLITYGLEYSQIYFYDSIISNFEIYHDPKKAEEAPLFPVYVNAIGLVLSKLLTTFFHHQTKFHGEVFGVKAANAVAALIYDKVTKSSIFIKNQISEGEILNYIQVDSEKLNFLFTSLPSIIIIPFNIIISFYALFKLFGLPFLVGVAMIIIMILIIWIVQYRYLVNTKIVLLKKDKRMRITTHSLHIIKILKLFGWEDEFKENIDQKRKDELINIRNIFNLIALRNFVNSNLSILTSLASIGGYTLIYGPMEVSTLFTSTQLINEVAEPTINIPQYIADLKSLMISLNRIQNFLVVKDIEKKEKNDVDKEKSEEIELNEEEKNDLNGVAIHYKNCNFGVKGEKKNETIENKILLKGINLTINKEELVTIIGETGSGKSCLINAILNNLELLNSNEKM